MKISVIVPAFNYGRFLKDVGNCLLAQTFTNWECIIVDNGSTDDTEIVFENYFKAESRFKYYKIEKGFPSTARNFGIKKATGSFIQFLDADDIISPDKFEKQLAIFASNAFDIVYGDYRLTDENLENHSNPNKNLILSGKAFDDFVLGWEKYLTIPIHSYLIKIECFTEYGMMDENILTHEDWELQLKFSLSGLSYYYHRDLVAFYRIHKASSARNNRTQNRSDTLYVLNKYLHHSKVSIRQKSLIIMRYCEFVGDIILDKIRFNNVSILKAMLFTARPILNLFSLLTFPVYIIYKVSSKILVR